MGGGGYAAARLWQVKVSDEQARREGQANCVSSGPDLPQCAESMVWQASVKIRVLVINYSVMPAH